MYQIRCDDYILYDPRDEELSVLNPKCKLEVNTVGSASFTIMKKHPFYDKLKKLKSIFEIRQDSQVIFRGRMTGDSRNFNNQLFVDLEGILAVANDSIIPPFNFPDEFPDAGTATNVVEYFLNWVLEQHNTQVQEWQKLKLGFVTVSDPNNFITRSSDKYQSTWGVLKSKLFDSSLGGFLCVRYESDGTYVDYVNEFELTNTQHITFGENLCDLKHDSDAVETCSAILPLGAKIEDENGNKYTLTLESLEDGDLTDDLVKEGKFIYSKSAVESYGWICVPISKSTWNDVTEVGNLKTKAMSQLSGSAVFLSDTITIRGLDLHFTNEQIQSFRVYRNVVVNSLEHGLINAVYQLTKLDIDLFNPQNTTITVGKTIQTLSDNNDKNQSNTIERVESVEKDIEENRSEISYVKNQQITQSTQLINDCEQIILAALKSYVETSNFEEYKSTVSTQLQILADEILMNFTTTTEHIVNVDDDLQSKFTEIYKYISFADGNIKLGSSENAITLTIENDMIVFKKNGQSFGWWDGVDFHTGNIIVEVNEKAQLGNFAFIPRTDGSLMFLKVGG